MLFPPHTAELSLDHNAHRDMYESLATYLRRRRGPWPFASEEAHRLALLTDEFWELRWDTETAAGGYVVAPTLSEVLALACPGAWLDPFPPLPPHQCGLFLEHNPQKRHGAMLADWLEGAETSGPYPFPDDQVRARCLADGELWTLQWYPNTPVAFWALAEYDFAALWPRALQCVRDDAQA